LELAASLDNLGALHLALGRPSRAEPFYRRAYQLQVKALGPNHPKVGGSLHGLAQAAHQLHRYSEAEELYRRAVALSDSPLRAADVAHNFALLYHDMHRDADAIPLLESAEAAYAQTAPNHPKLAVILRNLAELEAAAGNRTRAGDLFERAVRICEVSLPPDHPQTGIILQAYGQFLYQTKRKADARAVTERSRAILARTQRDSGAAYTVDASSFARK
jgi:tetratricopeptide (TPR) repeat protein